MSSTVAGLTPENYEKYRYNRLIAESGGKYTVVNSLGFAGGYQMGAAAAETVGLLKPGATAAARSPSDPYGNSALNDPNNWVGKNGAPKNLTEFLYNTAAQDEAYRKYTAVNARTLETTRTPQGTYLLSADTPQAERAGLLGAASLAGPTGIAKKGLDGYADINGTTPRSVFNSAAASVGGPTTTIPNPAASSGGASRANVGGSNTTTPSGSTGSTGTSIARPAAIVGDEITSNYTNAVVAGAPKSNPSTDIALPIPNPLNDFISFNYLFTLSNLTAEDINFPETSYLKGNLGRIIFSSAGRFSENRVSTAYTPADNPSGKYDFFIDNVEMTSMIAPLMSTKGSNSVTIGFDVIEPYSIGQFLQSCQIAAVDNKHPDYTKSPFLLTLEFKGYTQDNLATPVANTTRFLPISMHSINMSVSAGGCRYQIKAHAWSEVALSDTYNVLKQDTAISGETVVKMLQSGENSLEQVVNSRLKAISKADKTKDPFLPDEIAIIFPIQGVVVSASNDKPTSATKDLKGGSTGSGDVEKNISLSRNTTTNLFVQAEGDISALGKASLGFDLSRGGQNAKTPDNPNTPTGAETTITVAALDNRTYARSSYQVDPKKPEFVFKKDTTIINAITEVMLMSDYCTGAVTGQPDATTGNYDWFRIEAHTYLLTPNDVNKALNIAPKLLVFRVVPYKIHHSKFMAPNTTPLGYEAMVEETVKRYEYIYTGKNTDIIDFKLTLTNNFATDILADGLGAYSGTALLTALGNQGASVGKQVPYAPPASQISSDKAGGDSATGVASQGFAPNRWQNSDGSDADNYKTLVAKVFQKRILNADTEKVAADLEIVGDPYYIADSGLGNYTNTNSTSKINLTETGAMDYQSSEVDIFFNFRTPVDLNPAGSLTFPGDIKTQLEVPFSGLYQVIMVKSYFVKGKFTQTLQLMRRPNQNQTAKENLIPASGTGFGDGSEEDLALFPSTPPSAAVATNDKTDTPVTFGKPSAATQLASGIPDDLKDFYG